MVDDSIFAFAGIWDSWSNPQGQTIKTCSIITTTPNALLADIHDRMPVILPDDAYDLWLDPGFQTTDDICDLLKPFDPNLMRRYEVSSRVNLVKNDDPECEETVVRLSAAAHCDVPKHRHTLCKRNRIGAWQHRHVGFCVRSR
jgi:putative SOS response-associated peptidase YedK